MQPQGFAIVTISTCSQRQNGQCFSSSEARGEILSVNAAENMWKWMTIANLEAVQLAIDDNRASAMFTPSKSAELLISHIVLCYCSGFFEGLF